MLVIKVDAVFEDMSYSPAKQCSNINPPTSDHDPLIDSAQMGGGVA